MTALVGQLSLWRLENNGPERGLVCLRKENSGDPDQMPLSVASGLSLHCLQIFLVQVL